MTHPFKGTTLLQQLSGMLPLFLMTALTTPAAHAVMNVGVQIEGVLLGSSNFNDRTNVVVSYDYDREYPVLPSPVPLWGTVSAFGEANGAAGTLKARVAIQNAGQGSGVLGGYQLGVRASMSESINLFSSNVSGTRNIGLAGLGNPNDNYVTVRARGTLLGYGVVGAATGAPGVAVGAAGSTHAVFSLALGLNGSPLTSYTITETTNLDGPAKATDVNLIDINLGYSEVSGGDLLFHISKTYLSNNSNATVYFGASLTANALAGQFSGSFAEAAYHNSAYLDFDVEQGAFWLPNGTSATRKFLTAQVFPPAPVPEPATMAMWLAGVGVIGAAARRRRPG